MPENGEINATITNAENDNGPTVGSPTGAEVNRPHEMSVTMEMMADPWAPLRDSTYPPQNPNGPNLTPRTTEDALDLITGPFPLPIIRPTTTPLHISRYVAPLSTEILRHPRTDGPQLLDRETMEKVAEETTKMVDTARLLTYALRDACEQRDVFFAELKACEQKLKDRATDFEHQQRHQQLIFEAIFGGGDVEEPLVPPGRDDN
jgi:hypothetical protein